jgi:hypothetical protein
MASISETGHAKNVTNLETLIGYCTGYGASYDPSKADLKLPALITLLTNSNAALQAVKTAKIAYDNAINAREVTFKPLKSLATKIVNALAASDAILQTVNNAKSANNKIQGKRVAAAKEPESAGGAVVAAMVKKAFVSQQSYDKLIDHFSQLIQTLAAEATYTPNENELKVSSLNILLADLKARNAAVITAIKNVSNARIARDKILYADQAGLVDIATDVKLYLKSLFGVSSPQYKQISAISFRKVMAG